MSDSDIDYFYIGESDGTVVDEDIDDVVPAPKRSDKLTYENSAFFLDIKKKFTMRRGRETDFIYVFFAANGKIEYVPK
jgi:hypothetical protein